jgi:predicted AlkP superfamily phosphohydrolase/phosphomutase/Flp pilus assembly protein TadD
MRAPRWLPIALIVLCLHGCSSKPSPNRILVLGFDGMDPQTVDLLLSEGKLPNFAKLRQEGAYGRLLSSQPLLSPVVWTTIATGKTPEEHHIGHFVAVNEKTGEQLPVTSQMRQVKAIWNMFSDAGRTADVVGYWATWPAETVNGTIVSDHTCYHFLFTDGAMGAPDDTGMIYPPEMKKALAPLIRRPGELKPEDVAPFVHVSADELARPFDFNDDLSHFKWALATADSYRRIGLQLWQTQHPDLLMVYIEGTDSTAHLFGHLFRARGLAGELAAQQQRFGDAVEQMYHYADTMLGEYLAAIDNHTTLVVLSDHGFNLGALQEDPSKTRDMRRVSERYHRLEGILYLYGNHVKAGARIEQPTILDVTPTLLALAGLSPARDMSGRVLTEAFNLKPQPRTVTSYETGERLAAAPAKDAAVDPAVLEHLRSLGYLDTQSPKGERNLAAVQFQNGHYAEAVKSYEQLVAQHPEDAALRASLGGALGALGRFDEALDQLNRAIAIEPLNPEAYHNRAVIYERQGRREAAITEYRTAQRYSPQYEPSRRALQRLTGSAAGKEPVTEAEKLAAAKAERASQAARRGDYQTAMKELDDAQRLAPNYALLYQYRANVAFLMGDRQAAAAALHKAMEIEPDNALFKSNLQRLEQNQTPPPTAVRDAKP